MKRSLPIVLLTLAVAAALSLFVGSTIDAVNEDAQQTCFARLVDASRQLADELRATTETDRTMLTAMATLIADRAISNDAQLCEIMTSYHNSASYISYVELLRPDGTMLHSDLTVRDVADSFDFTAEARKGAYVSDGVPSTRDPDETVIRNAVPVRRGGRTIYMLYGVTSLSDFAQKYKTTLYGGHAYVYLVEGDTGNFLLDTWHQSRGNLQDISTRRMLPGYSFERAIAAMQVGESGDLAFVSKTTGGVLYLHFEPVGVNRWTVGITVEEAYAMRESQLIRERLYRMAAVVGTVALLYMACLLLLLLRSYRRVRRLGMEDQTTGLQNRNAYDAFIAASQSRLLGCALCVYIDVNGLHEVNNRLGHREGDQMLRAVADALKEEFPARALYRAGGDEFVALCENLSEQEAREKMERVSQCLAEMKYTISFGIVCRQNEMGVSRITQEADARMLQSKRDYYARHDRRQRS
ncbi:MAG: diguanylate cyclase [Eubacteriales bacterium]|nr:diguanylate cyclase [Eubacteriales bacterium]